MKFFTTLIFVAISIASFSQDQHPVLFGVSRSGNGGIFRYREEDNSFKNVYRFKNSGTFRASYMVAGKDGNIYGVAEGGPYGYGIIYSLDPATNTYRIRKNFHENDGYTPNAALAQGKNGKLYGTAGGGRNRNGMLFSFDPATSDFQILLHFDDVSYSSPGPVTMASDGLLYGIASQFIDDHMFSFDPEKKEFHGIVKLPPEIRVGFSTPEAMVEGPGGILYGLMEEGGANESGALFSYSLGSQQFTKLVDFDVTFGMQPSGILTLGSDGKMYSTTKEGGDYGYGTIFCFDPKNSSIKAIHHFDGKQGSSSSGGLTEGADGKLYGMADKLHFDYSNPNQGSVFYRIEKNGDNYKVLRDFDHSSRLVGEGNFILLNHKLYGTAVAERSNPYEYIFSYQSSQDLFQQIIRTNDDKGTHPEATLLQARDGRFYGVTRQGGGFGSGGIFSFHPGTGLYKMLLPFNEERGTIPLDELVEAGNGKLYGLTVSGGSGTTGVIFSFDPTSSRYGIEKNFAAGFRPLREFVQGKDGNLYAVLQVERRIDDEEGYEYQLFSFNPTTGKYTDLVKVCCGRPGSFAPSSDGKLYAVSERGIYCYDPAANSLELISPGEYIFPTDKLIEATDHKLYGMTATDGSTDGFLYSFDPADRSFAVHFSFNELTGTYPSGSLLPASDGRLYGTTAQGGQNGLGTLFSFDPQTQSFKLLRHFDNYSGDSWGGQLAELNTKIPPIVSITDKKIFEDQVAELTLSLNRISTEAITLNYRTVAGTASDGPTNPDFIQATGQVMIPPGEISTTISVFLLQDELLENRETFTVVLQKANEAHFQLGDSVGVINIQNGTAPMVPAGGEIITVAAIAENHRETIGQREELLIRAMPNPSSNYFKLQITGNTEDRLSVTVTNLSGQIMDRFDGALRTGQLEFGQKYTSGMYFVRILEGNRTKVIKLIKSSK